MDAPVDRRGFLLGLAAGALDAGLGGCGATSDRTGRPAAGGRARRTPPRKRRPTPRTLREAVRGPVFDRGRPGYPSAARLYDERFDAARPRAVVQPLDESDALAALRWTLQHDLPFRLRSGGHSYAGYSTLSDGIVIDLRRLSRVHVSRAHGTVTAGPGTQLIDLYAALAGAGAALPAGSCPSVGLGGMALGGGMGLAGRAWGVTADHLAGARLATADGNLSALGSAARGGRRHRHDRDLLWALRGGGGGNFGMVTELTFRVRPLPSSAAYFFVSWPWSSAAEATAAWLGWAPHTDERLTSILHLEAGGGTTSVSANGQFLGPEATMSGLLAPLLSVPGARLSTGAEPWLALQLRWAGCATTPIENCHTAGRSPHGTLERASFVAGSDYLARPLPAAALTRLTGALEQRSGEPGSGAVLFDAYGGAINRVAPDATAFVHREMLCCLQYLSYGGGDAWLTATQAALRPHVSGQAYQNYIDPKRSDWRAAYYAGNYSRLAAIRREVDPEHRFRFPQAIGV